MFALRRSTWLAAPIAAALLTFVGCPGVGPTVTGTGGGGDVSQAALSFDGSLSGTALTVSSTEGQSVAAAKSLALQKKADRNADGVLSSAAVGWLEDLAGNRLRDANGAEYPNFEVGADGLFDVQNLPVGVDIVLVIDADGDGDADMHTIINIPKNSGDDAGSLSDSRADPLSTLVLEKLRELAATYGVDLDKMGISPSALVERVRDAYEHLFEDAGIEEQIILSQIQDLSPEQLRALFASLIPTAAQRGVQMAEGNLALSVASDVEGVVKAVARILVQGGFVIADEPGRIDLSFLGGLPNVVAKSFEEFHQPPPGGPQGEGPGPSGFEFVQPVLYVSELAQPDRNFANNEDRRGDDRGPIFGEHVLVRMAEAFLARKTITLRELHRIVVNLGEGMGARLTYHKPGGPNQPPVTVFQAPDGSGIEVNMEQLFQQLQGLHLDNPDPAVFEQRQAELRALMSGFLAGTAEPSFDQLFDGILTNRIGSADEYARKVRDARAHLPFSRSGPASFYVVATADSFRDSTAKPVTVNVETDADGKVSRITYDPTGAGKFYVGFGPMTDAGMEVQPINRRTGRPLHDERGGRQVLEMANGTIFQPVNGESFLEAFSESGTHYPGAPALRLPNPGYNPNLPPDPQTNPPAFEAFVLLNQPGPSGTPVRVNYANGVATAAEAGRYYMLFDPRTPDEGLFALISETGEMLQTTPGEWNTRVLVAASAVQGANLAAQTFRHIFGIDAPNAGYDPAGDPYYDDVNGNGVPDAGEPTFSHREFLFDPSDWRSTRIEYYYRRADNNGFPRMQDVAFESDTPKMRDGTPLVARSFKPRLNAFRFGRPNVTINLLAAFAPPTFFNGTAGLNADTRVNPFMALALLNLVFDGVKNVTATVDWDGPQGPQPPHEERLPADFFIMPIGDPVQLITEGFERLAQ